MNRRYIAKPAIEMLRTPTFVEPPGEGWKYDGGGCDIETGECDHFWTRVRPNFYTDRVYTIRSHKIPAGEGWAFDYIHASRDRPGSKGQQRFMWSRTYEVHADGSRTYEVREDAPMFYEAEE
jgi:hypothetical protein